MKIGIIGLGRLSAARLRTTLPAVFEAMLQKMRKW